MMQLTGLVYWFFCLMLWLVCVHVFLVVSFFQCLNMHVYLSVYLTMLCATPLSLHVTSELCRSPHVCWEGIPNWECVNMCVCVCVCVWSVFGTWGNTLRWALGGYLGAGFIKDERRNDGRRRNEKEKLLKWEENIASRQESCIAPGLKLDLSCPSHSSLSLLLDQCFR